MVYGPKAEANHKPLGYKGKLPESKSSRGGWDMSFFENVMIDSRLRLGIRFVGVFALLTGG